MPSNGRIGHELMTTIELCVMYTQATSKSHSRYNYMYILTEGFTKNASLQTLI